MYSGQIVYHYQFYEIIEWFYENSTNPSPRLVELVRHMALITFAEVLKNDLKAFLSNTAIRPTLSDGFEHDKTNDPSERAEIIFDPPHGTSS